MNVAIEKNLLEYKKALEEEKYTVFELGTEPKDTSIVIVSSIDQYQEGTENCQCHGKTLVVDVSEISVDEMIKLIEKKECQ